MDKELQLQQIQEQLSINLQWYNVFWNAYGYHRKRLYEESAAAGAPVDTTRRGIVICTADILLVYNVEMTRLERKIRYLMFREFELRTGNHI